MRHLSDPFVNSKRLSLFVIDIDYQR